MSNDQVLRVGIGGPVGSGKTALVERLIPALSAKGVELAVITNDLVTHEERVSTAASRVVRIEDGLIIEGHALIESEPDAASAKPKKKAAK